MSNYPLRLPDHIMTQAKTLAADSGTSLNQFLGSLVAERIGELRAIAEFERRAARADINTVRAILARVPDRPPLPGDEIIEAH
jgi:hypothetical protein